jgi:hypothetical protein
VRSWQLDPEDKRNRGMGAPRLEMSLSRPHKQFDIRSLSPLYFFPCKNCTPISTFAPPPNHATTPISITLLHCTRPLNDAKSLPLFQHRYLPSPTMLKSQLTRNDIQRQASRVDLSLTGIFYHVMLCYPASDFMRCGFSNVGCQCIVEPPDSRLSGSLHLQIAREVQIYEGLRTNGLTRE